MPKYIVRMNDFYLEWSTITDSPITFGMSLDEFRDYYRDEYGRSGYKDLDGRLERVERNGTSSFSELSVHDLVSFNRAGSEEAELSESEIYDAYCLRKPIRGGWTVPVVGDDDGGLG